MHKHIQGLIKGCISIEMEHSKVDIVTTQCCLQHIEAHSHTLQPGDLVKEITLLEPSVYVM